MKTSPEVIIRPMHTEDWSIYRNLRLDMIIEAPSSFNFDPSPLLLRNKQDWEADMYDCYQDPDRQRVLATGPDERALGMVGMLKHRETLKVGELYVQPEVRGLGVGNLLMSETLNFAGLLGVRSLSLWVSHSNRRALSWYKSAGFHSLEPPVFDPWWDGSQRLEELLYKELK